MKKLLSKKEKARRQSIRRSPQIKQAIRRLDPARILTLDLETTGLTADAEIIQLSIMNGCGDVLMNRYFKPLYTERWDEAMEVNHITPEQVACEDPFILWADTVSSLFMDADLIVGYSTFNDIAKLHASGVVLPDKDIYLDLAEAFSLIHYQETKTITYEKLMNCKAHELRRPLRLPRPQLARQPDRYGRNALLLPAHARRRPGHLQKTPLPANQRITAFRRLS